MEQFMQILMWDFYRTPFAQLRRLSLAAMGGLLTEQAGVMDIGMDGMILVGCFAAAAFSFFLSSAGAGVLAAVAAGALIGLFFRRTRSPV